MLIEAGKKSNTCINVLVRAYIVHTEMYVFHNYLGVNDPGVQGGAWIL